MRRRRIVFHIGLAKTGTTSFQRFCHRHRARLLRRGVLYPRHGLGRARNHTPLAASYIAHRPEGPTLALRWPPRAQAVAAVRAEIDASPADTVLISSEHFSTHCDRSEALDLVADFGDHDCSILLALRDTHGRFLSSYNTHVTAGGRLSIEDYAHSVLVPGTRFMSMRETIQIWQEAFGRDHVRLVDYDACDDIVPSLLRAIGINSKVLPDAAPDRRRVSLGQDAIEILRHANALIAARQTVGADASEAAWVQLSAFSILCRRRLERVCGSREGAWTLGSATIGALDSLASADARWLRETHGLVLAGSPARGRMVVDDAARDQETARRRAEALVAAVSRGLWTPSQWAVGLWDRLAATRRA